MDSLTAADILGPEGRIAARLKNYEHRPQQLEMADAVARAIAAKRHLVAEAGTGVGKSFAYLVPAILAATEREAHVAESRRDSNSPVSERPPTWDRRSSFPRTRSACKSSSSGTTCRS